MQRQLTKDEVGRIAKSYDSLLGFPPELDNSATQGCRMVLQDMLRNNTTDGQPYVEPPLTDEDARQRPWVMVRDISHHKWNGPHVLIGKTSELFGFVRLLFGNAARRVEKSTRQTVLKLIRIGADQMIWLTDRPGRRSRNGSGQLFQGSK